GELLDWMVETHTIPLPDADELNKQIPVGEWEKGLDGKPRPPWGLYFAIYLISPEDGATYTFINCTMGARIAYERLADRIQNMRMMRGADMVALIALDTRMMKTRYGQKQRPDFKIIDCACLVVLVVVSRSRFRLQRTNLGTMVPLQNQRNRRRRICRRRSRR